MKIRKNRRKKLPVAIAVCFIDRFPIENYLAFLRGIESNQQFGQSGLAAAVASHQKSNLSGTEIQIYGTERKQFIALLMIIPVQHAPECKGLQAGERRVIGLDL